MSEDTHTNGCACVEISRYACVYIYVYIGNACFQTLHSEIHKTGTHICVYTYNYLQQLPLENSALEGLGDEPLVART